MKGYRVLSGSEIETMAAAGCSAEDWSAVQVKDGFDPRRVRNVRFAGRVKIGALQGSVSLEGGVELPAEIADATLVNCELGDNVRVARIHSHLANYKICSGAVVTDVGSTKVLPNRWAN